MGLYFSIEKDFSLIKWMYNDFMCVRKPGTAIQIQNSKYEICYLEFQIRIRNSKYVFGIPNTYLEFQIPYSEFQIRIWNSKYPIRNSKYVFGIPNSIFHILNLDGGSRLSYVCYIWWDEKYKDCVMYTSLVNVLQTWSSRLPAP